MRETAAHRLDRTTSRVLASHACGAVALSVPFPGLVAELSERSAGPLELGIAGASRMLPYVVLSWFAGLLADRVRRDLVVRGGLWLRLALALAAGLAVVGGRTWVAVALCTVAVAVSLPAYPAVAAGLPSVAGSRSVVAVEVLVTIEVGSFVVGGALGGLMLQPATRPWLPLAPVVLTLLALLLFHRVVLAAPHSSSAPGLGRAYRTLLASPSARGAVAVMASINLVGAFVALALLPLARDSWDAGAEGYGLATAVLGFAALGAPLGRVVGGRTARQSLHRMMPLLAGSVLLLVPATGVAQALPALAVLGALSVGAEARATRILTRSVPDSVRATVLGINDAAIVAAAMLGTLVAPWALEATSTMVVFGAGAVVLLAPLLLCRPRTESEPGLAAQPRRVRPRMRRRAPV
jgi:predicted MFS family arabinose efflux permease